MPSLQSIRDDLAFLDDWDERYRYLIDLGKQMPPLPAEKLVEANRVQGCASQVWLVLSRDEQGRVHLLGDSDALIVKGLVALVIAIFDGATPTEIAALDAHALFAEIGLRDHLTSQRANGLASMVARIKAEAAALAP
ncbi:MAG: SufE family protein [Proteobacteria bacterium]|nr:SufE family protein [Pseudomonadota bacterium]